MDLHSHPLFQKLLSLDLPAKDYAVFGSGPMLAHGIRETINDVDVIARDAAWERAKQFGPVMSGEFGGDMIDSFEGKIQIFNSWVPGFWDIDHLVDTAETIEGIPFVKLEYVLKEKVRLARKKDLDDVEVIKKYLAAKV